LQIHLLGTFDAMKLLPIKTHDGLTGRTQYKLYSTKSHIIENTHALEFSGSE
jgi:hypothetical protein